MIFYPIVCLQQPASLTELHPRGGLPNVAAKGAAGQPLRVAFLGGSITAAEGWRVHTRENLKKLFPKSNVTEIFAAVSGTGSNFGAARLERDVLSKKPDLLFVEFAVNDGAGSARVEAQMEGIVRHTWAASPTTDICFVYTLSENMLPELQAGRYQSSAVSMERVAAHYGIPSLNFGVEVSRRVAAGTLVFTVPKDDTGFTKDRVHPGAAGHQLYAERLLGALPSFLAGGKAGPHALPTPLSPNHWQRARLLTLDTVTLSPHWSRVADTDPHLTAQKGGLVPPTWLATQPGARVAFRFKGTQLGLVGLKGPENGIFRVTVDGKSVEGTLFDAYSQPGRFFLKPWFFPETLPDTDHEVQIELLDKAPDKSALRNAAADKAPFATNGLYLSGVLVVGEQRWSGESYQLAWSDEFEGTKLNTEKWVYRTDSKHWSTQKPENVRVADGFLRLELKKEDAGDKHYTGAGVISQKTFTYGYYEARFKTPPGAGWHSSFWLMTHDGSGGTSPKATNQELDIIENDSISPLGYGVNTHKWNPEPHQSFGGKHVKTPDLSADFHTFGCEFTPTTVKYYFDGTLVQTVDATKFAHSAQHIWLTSIASHLGKTTAVDDTKLPAAVLFDYVRFYEKKH